MKKLLLSAVAALLVIGCASSEPKPVADDQLAALKSTLSQYQGACANTAFAQSRAKVQEAEMYRANRDNARSEVAYQQARQYFDTGLVQYNTNRGAADRITSEIDAQNSRLVVIRDDASKYAAAEYNAGVNRINAYQTDAQNRAMNCDVAGASSAVDQAEKELRYLEDLTYTRMNASNKNMSAAPVVAGAESYVVQKGDCLWKIAADKYANPYFWPLIYWSNNSSINDPDLIYPDQVLTIERNQSDATKVNADNLAKTRGAWSLYDNK